MTKVLVVTNRFIFGGIEQLLLNLFENINNPDIQIDLLTLISQKDPVLVDKVKSYGVGYYSLGLEKYNKIRRQFYHYQKLYSILKDGKYDVVHINITNYVRFLDLAVAKAAGVKVRIIHAHSANIRDSVSRKLLRPLRAFYGLFATDFCACSDGAAEYLFSTNIVKKRKYHIITNGIDVEKYLYSENDRRRVREKLGIKDELLIGHVGRFTEAKNHDFILEVFSKIKKMNSSSKLLLVGDGELKETIQKKISQLNIEDSVIMPGASPEVGCFLSAMDVFLFPSKWEGLGISAIEAQSNGLPCYVSENLSSTAIITSNCKKIQISKGALYWAETILNTYKRVNEVEKIKECGYDISLTVKQLERIYLKNSRLP